MADRDDARHEFNPKHRIVGAIVLVALVVVVVPMILSEREPPAELKGPLAVTARPPEVETKVVVTPVPAPEIRPKADEPPSKPAAAESKPKVEPKPAEARKPEPAPEKVAKPAPGKTGEDGWVVQVGIFSNTQNALQLRDKLKTLGHNVHTESVTVSGKKALRLRVGPFADRVRADKAQAQIRKETGIAGVVQSTP